MKLLANVVIAFCILASTTIVKAAESGDKPKRSPELQVLDRFVGAWEHEVTLKPAE
jgi:hypothetical protein